MFFSSETTSKLTNLLLETKNRRSKNFIGEYEKVLCSDKGTNKQINRVSTNKRLKTTEELISSTSMNNSYRKRKSNTKSVYVRKNRIENKAKPKSEKKSKQIIKNEMMLQSMEQSNAKNDKFGFSNNALNEESDQIGEKSRLTSFDCTVCGKQFREKSHLATHSRAHVDIRNFKCNECGNRYKTKTNLLFHMKTHEEAPFICKKCDKIFPERKVLMRHTRVVHRYVYLRFFLI